MRTRRMRCLIFATHTASDCLPRLARAARRVQGPRHGTFRKLEPGDFQHSARTAKCRWSRRSRRSWRRCEHACSIVVRAVLSPTAVLLLLPVASLLAICLLLHRGMAECVDVEHDHQGCCLLELRPGHHEPLLRDVPGPAQLSRHARARRQGQLCGLACSPMRTCCTSTYGVLGLRSWPTCCTSGERPPPDLSIGVRLVGAGSVLLA